MPCGWCFTLGKQPIVLPRGVERLIEAQGALAADPISFMAKINAARVTRTDLPAVSGDALRTDLT